MAVTAVVLDPPVFAEFTGQKGFKRAVITFDSTYPVGGEVITAANVGLSTIDSLQVTTNKPLTATTTNYATWDKANSKLQLFGSNGAAPAALVETATADQSACAVEVLAYGKLL